MSRMSRVLLPLIAAAAVVFSVRDARAAPAEKVRLGYFANVTHAQAVLGVSTGDFEKAVAPAAFSTKVFNAGPSLIEALNAGEIDIGYVGPSPAISAHLQSKGKGIRVIAGAAANGVVIVARPGSGIEKMEDLRGKRIATPQLGNTQDMSARHYLLKVLGAPNVDNVIPIPNAEQSSMMERGQIDASWAVEPWGSRLEIENHAKVIAEEKDLWPPSGNGEFTLTVIVVRPEFLAEHPESVEAVLKTHCAWTRRLKDEPMKQAGPLGQALEKLTGKKLAEPVIESALKRVKFTNKPGVESMETFAKWAADMGFAKGVANVKSLVDTKLIDSIDQQAPVGSDGKPGAKAP